MGRLGKEKCLRNGCAVTLCLQKTKILTIVIMVVNTNMSCFLTNSTDKDKGNNMTLTVFGVRNSSSFFRKKKKKQKPVFSWNMTFETAFTQFSPVTLVGFRNPP